MNAYKITEAVKTYLHDKTKDKTDPLFGVSIETDVYKQSENCLPFILIEGNSSKLITNKQGFVQEYVHNIEITCAVKAEREEKTGSRGKIVLLAEETVKALNGLQDYRFRIIPREILYGEVLIGSLKCSAAKLINEVKTFFIDE